MFLVPSRFEKSLCYVNEYGMGYQIALIKISPYLSKRVIILNATLFCPIDEYDSLSYIQRNYDYALRTASQITIVELNLIPRPLDKIRKVSKEKIESYECLKADSSDLIPAKSAPITLTSYGEVFKRYSAYEYDKRVTNDKGLTSGTFATTKEDSLNVKTGMEAIARYALENKQPANKVFTIEPPADTRLQKGVVEPEYGEPGGGEEVIFVDGSPAHTVSGPKIIPEK